MASIITNYHPPTKVLDMLQFDWHVQITRISSFMLGCISRPSLYFCALCTFVSALLFHCCICMLYLLSNERYSAVLPILNSRVRPRFVTFINHLNHHRDLLLLKLWANSHGWLEYLSALNLQSLCLQRRVGILISHIMHNYSCCIMQRLKWYKCISCACRGKMA